MTNYSHKFDLDDGQVIALENLLKFYFEYWNTEPADRYRVQMSGVNHQPILDIQRALEKSWEDIAGASIEGGDTTTYRLPFKRPDDR